jgi:hypothetical protein
MQGESAKTKEANSKTYNSTYKKGQDAKETANHKYETTKASADHHQSSFYHSAKDKTHSAKDTVAQKTHDVKQGAQNHTDDFEEEAPKKGEKAKDKVVFGRRTGTCLQKSSCACITKQGTAWPDASTLAKPEPQCVCRTEEYLALCTCTVQMLRVLGPSPTLASKKGCYVR